MNTSREGRNDMVHLLVHDLRTPLANIAAALDLLGLSKSVTADPAACRQLADARDSLQILEEMIDDILDVYKMEGGSRLVKSQPVPVASIIAEAVRMMGGLMKRHRFAYNLPPTGLMALCDPGLSARVILNFLTNAVRHSAAGSEIHLSAGEDAGRIRVSVSDESPALAPEAQEGLFDKIGRGDGRKKGKRSVGLGLVFSRMVAEAQGGQIGMVSRGGAGCTFWFTLPKPPLPDSPVQPASKISGGTR